MILRSSTPLATLLIFLTSALPIHSFSPLICKDIYWLDQNNDTPAVPVDALCNDFLGCACLPSSWNADGAVVEERMMCLRPQHDGYNTAEDIDLYASQVSACRTHCECAPVSRSARKGTEEWNGQWDFGSGGIGGTEDDGIVGGASVEDGLSRLVELASGREGGLDDPRRADYLEAMIDCGKHRCWAETDCETVRLTVEGCEDVLCMASPLKAKGYRREKLIQKYGVGRCKHSVRRKRDLEGESCVCNATYVGEACCGAKDGLVWGDGKLGYLTL